MRKLTPLLVTLILFTPHPLLAQDKEQTASFAAKPLQSGQPTLSSGQQLKFDFTDPRYAEISAGELVPSLFFLTWKDEERGNARALVIENPDGGFSLDMGVPLKRSNDGSLRGTVDVGVRNTATVPLELRLLPENNLLLYRWPTSSANQSSAGNEPGALESVGMIETGRSIPNFSVETLSGEEISLESLRGKNVVINWWATFCAPCIAEMPGLNKLVEKYDERSDIVFLAIAWNTKKELNRFFEGRTFAYRQAVYNERTSKIFGESFPRNVIVDASGKVVYDKIGGGTSQGEEINTAIQKHVMSKK